MTTTPSEAPLAHRLVTEPQATSVPWVDSPFFPALVDRATLDPEIAHMVRRYARDGYVIIDPQIPRKTLDQAVQDLEGRFKPTYHPYYADERRLQEGWIVSSAIKEIATAPRVLEVLRALYRREPIPFQTLNFRIGSEQATHSDTIHFHSVPNLFMAGVWVALEDIDQTNGPLHYYPSSHKLPIYNMADLGVMAASPDNLYQNYWMYEQFVQTLMGATQLERVEMKIERGQALIWAANLFHGGSPIIDHERTRLSQVTHYFFSDCMYYTPLLSDVGLGRTSLRKVIDLRTCEEVNHVYNGRKLENINEWPPRLSGCELAPSPAQLLDADEMARRNGLAPASDETAQASTITPSSTDETTPASAIMPPSTDAASLRKRFRSLLERTLGR